MTDRTAQEIADELLDLPAWKWIEVQTLMQVPTEVYEPKPLINGGKAFKITVEDRCGDPVALAKTITQALEAYKNAGRI